MPRMYYHGEDEIPERLLDALAKAPVIPEYEIDGFSVKEERTDLTDREVQVLKYMSYGLEYKMTADMLGVGFETIQSTLKRIRRVLKAKNTAHAVAIGLRRGLIT